MDYIKSMNLLANSFAARLRGTHQNGWGSIEAATDWATRV